MGVCQEGVCQGWVSVRMGSAWGLSAYPAMYFSKSTKLQDDVSITFNHFVGTRLLASLLLLLVTIYGTLLLVTVSL